MALLVGVTGGIGAGKTTALRTLEKLGQHTLDADRLVHGLYQPGSPVVDRVRARYGEEVVNAEGDVDRQNLANIVFDSRKELEWLNRLVHPLVKERIAKEGAAREGLLFCGVPLLFEVEWEKDFGCTLAVWCDRQTQNDRLRARGWSEAEIERRRIIQMTMDEKMDRADYAVINNSALTILQKQLELIIQRITERFK